MKNGLKAFPGGKKKSEIVVLFRLAWSKGEKLLFRMWVKKRLEITEKSYDPLLYKDNLVLLKQWWKYEISHIKCCLSESALLHPFKLTFKKDLCSVGKMSWLSHTWSVAQEETCPACTQQAQKQITALNDNQPSSPQSFADVKSVV